VINMPTVRLSFTPAPAHVRTARLVGVAMARRAGVADELLEEIRLAIGEACTRAVALHRSAGLSQLVDVTMTDDDRFVVRVTDHGADHGVSTDLLLNPRLPGPEDLGPSDLQESASEQVGEEALVEEAMVARMCLALLAGSVNDLQVVPLSGGIGTEVRMSWPLGRVKRENGN
jgi:hypothetical protein